MMTETDRAALHRIWIRFSAAVVSTILLWLFFRWYYQRLDK